MITQRTNYTSACFTADVEEDCPPYLKTCRGMSEGMPRLLDLLSERQIRGTFFTTGEMARRFPAIIRRLVADGHELGCHGDFHRDFTKLTREAAETELRLALQSLREFAPVVCFRAPYLRYPSAYLPLLVEQGLQIDSSVAGYKTGSDHLARSSVPGLTRVPASLTSSILRLPSAIRAPWLALAKPPLVLFVHPWEAVDFRRSGLRWDCRFRTGQTALSLWRDVLTKLQRKGAHFLPMCDIGPLTADNRLNKWIS